MNPPEVLPVLPLVEVFAAGCGDMRGQAVGQSGDAPPAEIIRSVVREVTRFADDAPQPEDVTLLALRYRG